MNHVNNLKLWYKQPASNWNEALPIGNGRLGAMVFANVLEERIQLNEDSVWYGGPLDRNNPDAFENLAKLRELIFAGKLKEAEKLAVLAFSGIPYGQRVYQTLGDINIYFEHQGGKISNYHRELDLNEAVVNISYKYKGVNYKREVFSTAVDQIIVIRITADKAASISFRLNLERGKWMEQVFPLKSDILMMKGHCGGEGGSFFRTMLKAVVQGGSTNTLGENLLINDADQVCIYFAAETSFYHKNPKLVCEDRIRNALEKGYSAIKRGHLADYQNLFKQMEIQLTDNLNRDNEKISNFENSSNLKKVLTAGFLTIRELYLLMSGSVD